MKLFMFLLLTNSFRWVILENIPIALWNINGNSLLEKQVPVFSQNGEFYDEILQSVSINGPHLLMFTIDKLSLEDFSVQHIGRNNASKYLENFLNDRPYVFISSIASPLLKIENVECGRQRIEVNEISQITLKNITSTLLKSCIVIVHFSEGFQFDEEETFKNVLMMSSEKFSFDVIGAFTADKPSLRLLLLEGDSIDAKDIISVKNCILFYAGIINVTVGPLSNEAFGLSSPNTDSSVCTETKTKLVLAYKPSKDIDEFNITFLFKNRGFYWQTYPSLSMRVKNTVNRLPITFSNVTISAPSGKSYFCEGARIKSHQTKYQVSVYFNKLKVQPFSVKGKEFSESFLEKPSYNFMTLAIWEGVIIAITYLAIILCGIYHLAAVPSMERFDDAKDKTASISIVTPN